MRTVGTVLAVFASWTACGGVGERAEDAVPPLGIQADDPCPGGAKPVSLFLAVDKSNSMGDPADPSKPMGPSKWQSLTNACSKFFEDPSAAPLQIALRLWPDAGCTDPACDPTPCAQPQVALAPLSDAKQVTALQNALKVAMPSGNTPMSAALTGAVAWARQRKKDAPGDSVAIVLETDGGEGALKCVSDVAAIANIARNAYQDYGIYTYVVGITGSLEDQTNQIASAGGTVKAYFVTPANTESGLLAALDDIRQRLQACNPGETGATTGSGSSGSGPYGGDSPSDGTVAVGNGAMVRGGALTCSARSTRDEPTGEAPKAGGAWWAILGLAALGRRRMLRGRSSINRRR